ncbi:hypothetical protein [Mycobacterium sp. C31M]
MDKINAVGRLSFSSRHDRLVLFVAALIEAPLIALLPLSILAKLCALQRWEIEIERGDEWRTTEQVRGWSASVGLIESITAEVSAGTYSAPRHDLRNP